MTALGYLLFGVQFESVPKRGLLGSWAWVASPLWPLEKTVASLNMDMIGRNEEVPEGGGPRFFGLKPQTSASNANSVNIIGYSFNPELADMVKGANKEIDLTLKMDTTTTAPT